MNADRSRPAKGLPRRRWRGFTLQLFLFTVLPLTLLLLVIAFGSLTLHHDSMRALVGDRDLRAVRAAANSLSREIERRSDALDLLAQSGITSADALSQAAEKHGFDGGLVLFDAGGSLLAHSPGAAGQILSLANMQHVQASPARAAAVATGTGQHDWLVLSLSQPGPAGQLLAGAYSPAALAGPALSGVITGQTTVLLLSPDGRVLFHMGQFDHTLSPIEHPGVDEVLRGESGVSYTPASAANGDHTGHGEASEHVVAYSPVPPLGWGLVLEESWEEIASPLLRTTQAAPLILAPVLLLAIFALWFGARQIVQPIQALEGRAARLAGGDFTTIQQEVGGISEIRGLQMTLVEMASDLQAAQDSLHGYIGALTDGLENERRGLARELHDDTLQALIALNQHVQLALLQSTPDDRQYQALLDLQNRVGQTITNLRRAIGGLRPIYLEDLGLVAALGMLARQSESSSGPEVTFRLRGLERRLPPAAELALYRISQEALNNALHHAQPNSVQIILDFSDSAVRLYIRDDGLGFTPPATPDTFARRGHFGLLGMRERADLVGAQLQIRSTPGDGTTVSLTYSD
jgi:signal transduction histidine kinase